MKSIWLKSAIGIAIVACIAATPFSHPVSPTATDSVASMTTARSVEFSAAMLEVGKARWARAVQAELVDTSLVDLASPLAPTPTPASGRDPEPAEETMGGATHCPVRHTECPAEMTVCPRRTTLCPVHQTVCKETECPEHDTLCPERPTRCVYTECPAEDTLCPRVVTACPEDETRCPYDETRCPEVFTECPFGPICEEMRRICSLGHATWSVGPPVGPQPSLVSLVSGGVANASHGGGGQPAPALVFLPAASL